MKTIPHPIASMASNNLIYHLISGAEEVVSRVVRVLLMAEQTVEDEKIAKVRTYVLHVGRCTHTFVRTSRALLFPVESLAAVFRILRREA